MSMMGLGSFSPGFQFQANGTDAGRNSSDSLPMEEFFRSLTPLFGSPLIRLLMMFHKFSGSHLGIDPTIILTILGAIWAANKLWKQLYSTVYGMIHDYAMSNVHVSSTDEMYLHMMKWLANQPNMVNSRSLAAETTSKTAWEDEDDHETLTTRTSADGVYLNFSNQEAKAPPRSIPALGTHGFWFNGRYFRLHRKQESLYDDGGASSNVPQFKDKENLVISCFGRSPEPIKRLLRYAKHEYYHDHYAKTIVKRPSPQGVRRYGGRYSWMQIACRPVRPLKTVVLDAKQKVQVLKDMNEYLHPATPRWYANRGIPLRRGYLFHGPPGTGKTSLSFALAGVFGLDIYVISLLEPSLTEEDLSALFNSLPRRCVVLLEDIDTAGLARAPDGTPVSETAQKGTKAEEDKAGTGTKTESQPTSSSKEEFNMKELARELKKQDANEKKGISLSGLLNSIDGVASHEGRVLIMTTNKPESLDDALIRPGRVDLQVGFTNATKNQVRELFERMYEADSLEKRQTVEAPLPRGLGADVVASLRPDVASTAPLPDRSILYGGKVNGHAVGTGKNEGAKRGHSHNGSTASSYDNCSDEDGSAASENASENMLATPNASSTAPGEDNEQQQDREGEKAGEGADENKFPARGVRAATLDDEDERDGLSDAELARIALEFADKIPESQFSPAEIQGFLLKRKKTPRRALKEVDVWVETMLKQKASRTKVLQVQ